MIWDQVSTDVGKDADGRLATWPCVTCHGSIFESQLTRPLHLRKFEWFGHRIVKGPLLLSTDVHHRVKFLQDLRVILRVDNSRLRLTKLKSEKKVINVQYRILQTIKKICRNITKMCSLWNCRVKFRCAKWIGSPDLSKGDELWQRVHYKSCSLEYTVRNFELNSF